MAVRAECDGVLDGVVTTERQWLRVMNLQIRASVTTTDKRSRKAATLAPPVCAQQHLGNDIRIAHEYGSQYFYLRGSRKRSVQTLPSGLLIATN